MHPSGYHCLRPEFTASLAERLIRGELINLTSPHGQGRRRTLSDLQELLPPSMLIIQMNMRFYRCDLKGFLKAVSSNFWHHDERIDSLSRLFELLVDEHEKVLLVLHNFDELWHGGCLLGGYDDAFFQDLNSIAERERIALLCVSEIEEPYKIGNVHLQTSSLPLPDVTPEQLLAELRYRKVPATEADLPEIAAWLLHQHAPYSQLDELDSDWFTDKGWLK